MNREEFENAVSRLISGETPVDEIVDIVTNIRGYVSELEDVSSNALEKLTETEKLNSELRAANSKLYMQIAQTEERKEEELAEETAEEITLEDILEGAE